MSEKGVPQADGHVDEHHQDHAPFMAPKSKEFEADSMSMNAKFKKEIHASNGPVDMGVRILKLIFKLFGLLLLIALMCGMSIANVVVGALYQGKTCDEDLSTFLIVFGVFGLASFVLSVCLKICYKPPPDGTDKEKGAANDIFNQSGFYVCTGCCSSLISLFLFAWMIVGSVWVYRLDPGDDYQFCDRILYLYTFWIITAGYISAAVICCCSCFLTCCLACIFGFKESYNHPK